MRRVSRKKLTALALAAALVWGGFFALLALRHEEKLPCYDTMIDAAQRMEAAMAELRAEKARRGIALQAGDIYGTGLIGPESSAIVTTLGALEAKRTAADSNMAALCVRIYEEAGLTRGDTLGFCMSGSFPGLVLASLAAADAMGLEVRYICSVGASTYGATDESFTLPEMLVHLHACGLLSTPPLAVTWGGEGDIGKNMVGMMLEEADTLEAIELRLEDIGYSLHSESTYTDNIVWRQELLGRIDCFVSVGGHLAAMGRDGQAYSLGEGLLKAQKVKLNERSGLVERYLNEGVPTVSLVNVKRLCLDYGMSFDGAERGKIGTSAVYFRKSVLNNEK